MDRDGLLESRPRPHPAAAMERVGGRWMVATPDDQLHYFVDDGSEEPSAVGDRILDLSDGTRTVREIARVVCDEFEVDAECALRDTLDFIRQLMERKVLTSSGEPQTEAPPATSLERER